MVPRQVFVHGYLRPRRPQDLEVARNVIDPLDLVDVYGVDPVRYYVARVARFGQDGNASVDDLMSGTSGSSATISGTWSHGRPR